MGERQTERAFVIQFDPIDGVRSRLRGRVELVGSGEAIRFRSLKQLMDFMAGTLRRRVTAAGPSRRRQEHDAPQGDPTRYGRDDE